MKKEMTRILSAAAASMMALGCTACSGNSTESASEGFTPKLDTEKAVTLEIAGFFGNFEALDQVENAFNEFYPNVTFSYEQNGGTDLDEYLNNNPYIDIFMTTDENVRFPGLIEKYAGTHCADLSADIDVSAIRDGMLDICYVDGKLVRVPMSQNLNGYVVNVSLLEKEGLSVPTNYSELTQVLEALKEKGYDPIQGPVDHVYSELAANMAYSIIGTDKELQEALYKADESAVEKLLPVYERLAEIADNGWTDAEVNAAYPADNYDQAILKFFEGDVPFWVCNTEKVGGMKKRESKSEAFTASPFEYKFMFVPFGDSGVYEYREPWYGFSVNKDCDEYDYAVEFLRFLATEEQLNIMAEIKGVPSVTNSSSDERYSAVSSVENAQISYTNDGVIKPHICTYFANTAKALCMGEYSSAEEAARAFVQQCSTIGDIL